MPAVEGERVSWSVKELAIEGSCIFEEVLMSVMMVVYLGWIYCESIRL